MSSSISFRFDMREFNAALAQYMGKTKRTLPDVLNKKAMYIARRACVETPATSTETIKTELGEVIRVKISRMSKRKIKGSFRTVWKSVSVGANLARADERSMPMAEAILRGRDYKAGRKQSTKAEMTTRIPILISARQRSRAFYKSGWLPSIRRLMSVTKGYDSKVRVTGVKQYGQDKGYATEAREGFKPVATIANMAITRDEEHGYQGLVKYGAGPLQRAINFEAASMREFLAREMLKDARAVGIKATP